MPLWVLQVAHWVRWNFNMLQSVIWTQFVFSPFAPESRFSDRETALSLSSFFSDFIVTSHWWMIFRNSSIFILLQAESYGYDQPLVKKTPVLAFCSWLASQIANPKILSYCTCTLYEEPTYQHQVSSTSRGNSYKCVSESVSEWIS